MDKKRFNINIYILILISAVSISFGFISGFIIYSDNVCLKHRNLTSLKNDLEQLRKESPDGVGGYDIPEKKTTPISFLNYIVKSGDSLHSISEKLGVDEVTIMSLNEISVASHIINGKKIVIPNQDGIIVDIDNSNSIKKIAKKYNIEFTELLEVNSITDDQKVDSVFVPGLHTDSITRSLMLGEFFFKPTNGTISSYFGYRIDPWTKVKSFHTGVDIRNSFGTKIKSAGYGQVTFVGNYWPLGNAIEIKHPGGYTTVYGHLQKILVKKNQWVKSGELIGKMGTTGRSTGSHLHYEVHKNGYLVNPFKVTIF